MTLYQFPRVFRAKFLKMVASFNLLPYRDKFTQDKMGLAVALPQNLLVSEPLLIIVENGMKIISTIRQTEFTGMRKSERE